MRTAPSLHPSKLITLLLLACISFPLATAQNAKPVETARPTQDSAQTRAEQAAQSTKPEQATQAQNTTESTSPSTNTQSETAKDGKEPERLSFALEETRENSAEIPSAGGLLLRTLGALLLIVGLIVAAGWGLRRFGGARFGAARKDAPELNVLTSVSLGSRRSLAVVRFGERNLLIGTTAQSVTLLAEEDMLGVEARTPAPRSVADLLRADEAVDFDEELKQAGDALNNLPTPWQTGGGQA